MNSSPPHDSPTLTANHAARPGDPTRFADATDGVKLAIYEYGDSDRPTALFVHGFPDDHKVWEPAIALAAGDFHIVTYDVRGTGASGQPTGRDGYAMSQLRNDLATVISLTSPGAVHLIAHDWGSIQGWSAATDPAFVDTLASFTSISGPSLDMAGAWIRRGRRHPGNLVRQLADSWYIFAFQLPFLPEMLVRRGVVEKLVSRSESIGVPADVQPPVGRRSRRDAINGIELYRANFRRLLSPRPARAVCPVQVIAPTDDAHVTVPLGLEAPKPFTDNLRTHEVPGNHWVVEQNPALIVGLVTDFINTTDVINTTRFNSTRFNSTRFNSTGVQHQDGDRA